MTPKTIFTIILKIFGLWLILELLEVIPQTISTIPVLMQADATALAPMLIAILLILTFYFFILRLLLFKTDYVINKLSLDKHFDQQTVDTNVQQATVIQIAIIILGGLMFIDALPTLIEQIVSYLQQERIEGNLFTNPSFKYIILYSCKLILGYLLMNNSRQLTNWIEHSRQK